jgi:hypothetical protein
MNGAVAAAQPVVTMTHAALPPLSADELRVLLRLAGATTLPLESDAEDGWAVEVADAVATRGLLARGLAQLTGAQLRIAPGARTALLAVTPADRLVQVDLEISAQTDLGLGRHVFVEGNGHALQLREREPDVWVADSLGSSRTPIGTRTDMSTRDIDETVLDLVQAHAAGSSGDTRPSRLDLDLHTHLQVDAAAADGSTTDVVQLLRVAGVDDRTASRWTAAITERQGAGAVRVARRAAGLGSDPALTGEGVGWVAAGAHGLWQVVEHEDGATITTTDLAALLAVMRDALAGDLGTAR